MTVRSAINVAAAAVLAVAASGAGAQYSTRHQGQDHPHGSQMMMQGRHGGGMMGHGMIGDRDGAMMGGMDHHGMMKMMDADNLSEEQQQKLADLHGEQAKEHFLLMQKMQGPRQRLHELMTAEQPDVEAIGETYDTLAELRKQALINRIEARRQMQKIIGQRQQQTMGQAPQRPGASQQ